MASSLRYVVLFLLALGGQCQWFNNGQGSRQGGSSCITPNQDSGSCVNIRRCPLLLDLLRNRRNEPNVADFLRQSVCGYEGRDPMVCCSLQKQGDVSSTGTGETSQPSESLLEPPQCGLPEAGDHTRIIGGQPAELGAWPWIVALGYRSTSKPGPHWLCGGALINRRYVVTAAHCTRHPRYTLYLARMGELDLNSDVSDGASPVDIRIEKVIPHESYNPKKYSDDIALLRLEKPVTFSKTIKPICLPKAVELRSNNFVKNFPFVAGWGATSFKGPSSTALMEVQIPVVENESCRKAYSTKGANITYKQMCAGYAKGGKDACQGDSGGPLMWPRGTIYYLIGVVSYGFKCAEPGFPGIYSRMTEYVDWISKNMT